MPRLSLRKSHYCNDRVQSCSQEWSAADDWESSDSPQAARTSSGSPAARLLRQASPWLPSFEWEDLIVAHAYLFEPAAP